LNGSEPRCLPAATLAKEKFESKEELGSTKKNEKGRFSSRGGPPRGPETTRNGGDKTTFEGVLPEKERKKKKKKGATPRETGKTSAWTLTTDFSTSKEGGKSKRRGKR